MMKQNKQQRNNQTRVTVAYYLRCYRSAHVWDEFHFFRAESNFVELSVIDAGACRGEEMDALH